MNRFNIKHQIEKNESGRKDETANESAARIIMTRKEQFHTERQNDEYNNLRHCL